MEYYTISLPNVTPIKLITAKATYGIGFLTAFVGGFCSLFGLPNNMFAKKLKKVEALAMEEMTAIAHKIGADGVMDVHCQIDGLSFLVSGTAYKLSQNEKAKRAAEQKAKLETKIRANLEHENAKRIVEATQNRTQTNVEVKKEEAPKFLPCPECGENLDFMGWSEDELKEQQTCPLCGKQISFNK